MLTRLVDAGNTVVVIEHNLDVIKTADWLIDLGPEGGDAGGSLVAVGTPEEVADRPESYTGQFLRPLLQEGRFVPVYANGHADARPKTNADSFERDGVKVGRERVPLY